MSLKALSDYTIYSRYAHYLPEKKRRETWSEIVDRVFGMHERKFKNILDTNEEFKKEFEFAKEMVRKKRVLGSQRALQFGGKWIEKHNLKMFNCSTSFIDRESAFQEVMYALLCGVGMGFSVQKHHIEKLPTIQVRDKGVYNFVIPDSIEGWSDAVGMVVNSYFSKSSVFSEICGKKVVFDFSLIRKKGDLIAGQFKAPGSEGLKASIEKIEKLIEGRLSSGENRLRSIDAYDVIMHFSDAVLSGGIRRAATLCMFSPDDEEMAKAKTGDWYIKNPQRARSNNSAALLKNSTTKDDFSKLLESTKAFGEPGFIFVDNVDTLYNPCTRGDAKVLTPDGVKTFNEIESGHSIWSKEGWTKVLKKWSNGIKDTYRYTFEDGEFLGTSNHKIDTRNGKQEIDTVDYAIALSKDGVIKESKLLKKEYLGEAEVFDITVDNESHTFWTGGISVSNCCEIAMIPMLDKESGVQVCNLTEINGGYCDTEENFYECCRAASIIGTLQAAYTDFVYLTPISKKICDNEALLGCSITGIMDNPDLLLDKRIQQKGASIVLEVNEKIAKMIGINKSARTTAVKPAGSTSCVLRTASGVHPHHSRRYIRNVQANKTEFPLQLYKALNPYAVQESVWSANKTDEVISFICEVPKGAIVKNNIGAVQFLKQIKLTQNNWVEYGTRVECCVDPKLRHNVSCTVTVKDNEWQDVEDYIYDNRHSFAGISLLSASGDLDYDQAPFTTVLTPSEMVQEYGDASILASGMVVDGLKAFNNNLWSACSCFLGHGEDLSKIPELSDFEKDYSDLDDKTLMLEIARSQYDTKKDWIRRAKQFSQRYFDGNDRKMTHCLKHAFIWHRWLELKRNHVTIDWSEVVEENQEYVEADSTGAVACSGGQCSLVL